MDNLNQTDIEIKSALREKLRALGCDDNTIDRLAAAMDTWPISPDVAAKAILRGVEASITAVWSALLAEHSEASCVNAKGGAS